MLSPERHSWFCVTLLFTYLLFLILTFLKMPLRALEISHFTLKCYISGFALHTLYKTASPCGLRCFSPPFCFHSNFISHFIAISQHSPVSSPVSSGLLFQLGWYPVPASSFLGHFLWPSSLLLWFWLLVLLACICNNAWHYFTVPLANQS